MMLPDRVKAAGDGGNTGISIGGYYADRRPFVYVDFTCGAWGARPWADGLDGNSHMFANMASHSIEVTEAEQPIQLLAYEFVPDKAGAGKYRGGVPFRRDYRFIEAEGMLQVRSDRRDHRPFGLYGGSPGRPSENYLNPEGENRTLPGKLTMTIRRGDVFRHVLAGAGGWGDPLERDPAAVLKDVRNELLSPGKAAADYGVVVDTRAVGRSTRPRRSGAARRSARPAAGTRCRRCSGTTRSRPPAAERADDHLSRRRRHRRDLHRHRPARLRRHDPHQEGLLERRTTTPRRSSTGSPRCSRRPASTAGDRGDPARHDGRLERDPRAQGRARRPDHHRRASATSSRSARCGCHGSTTSAGRSRRRWSSAICGRWSTSASTPTAGSSARSTERTPSARSMRCSPRTSRRSRSACSTPSPTRRTSSR